MSPFIFNIINLEWLVQNVKMTGIFLIYHCWFPLISIVIHIQAILDFQNNLYFQKTQQTNATIDCHLWKKKSSSSKGSFPCENQAFAPWSYVINLEKVNSFILEQIRISKSCPLTIIMLTTRM